VQLIPVKYYDGFVLGARDTFFRVNRGEGRFGSTESRQARELLEEVVAQRLADDEVARAVENGDL
jgi:hypothetical protein